MPPAPQTSYRLPHVPSKGPGLPSCFARLRSSHKQRCAGVLLVLLTLCCKAIGLFRFRPVRPQHAGGAHTTLAQHGSMRADVAEEMPCRDSRFVLVFSSWLSVLRTNQPTSQPNRPTNTHARTHARKGIHTHTHTQSAAQGCLSGRLEAAPVIRAMVSLLSLDVPSRL